MYIASNVTAVTPTLLPPFTASDLDGAFRCRQRFEGNCSVQSRIRLNEFSRLVESTLSPSFLTTLSFNIRTFFGRYE